MDTLLSNKTDIAALDHAKRTAVPLTRLIIDTPFDEKQSMLLRKYVNKHIGKQSSILHNHADDGKAIFRYPKVQYGMANQRPSIIAIGDEAVQILKPLMDEKSLVLGDKKLPLFYAEQSRYKVGISPEETKHRYKIKNYIALNASNYKKYKMAESLVDKHKLLQQMLKAHVVAALRSFDLWITFEDVQLSLLNIQNMKKMRTYGSDMLCFSLSISTNAILPYYIGIGKSVSIGFGKVVPQ